MDFGAILSRAFRITWQYKVLWILGFLAALGSGSWGGAGQSPQTAFRFNGEDMPWMRNLVANPNTILAGIAVFICLIFLLSIVFLVVGIIARGGLIAGVEQVETAGNTSFGRAWAVGAARFWHLLGLNILLWLPFIVIIVVLVILFGGAIAAAFATTASARGNPDPGAMMSIIGGGFVVLCCLSCLLVLYWLLAMVIQTFGERAIVLENAGITDSISRAWAIFRANLGNIILLALIMFVISIAFGLITGFVSLVILIPSIIPVIDEASRTGVMQISTILVALIGVIIATILAAIINALFVTFNSAAWTLAYRQFTGGPSVVTTVPPVEPPLQAA